MKSLLIFTENHSRGGGNRYMVDLINAVHNEYEDVLIASNKGGILPEDINQLNCQVRQKFSFFLSEKSVNFSKKSISLNAKRFNYLLLLLSMPFLFFFNIIFFIYFLLQNRPSQIICCNGGYPAARSCLALCIAGKILCIPVVLSIVSMPMPRISNIQLYEKMIDLLVWKSVNIVIVNAKSIKLALRDLRGLAEKKVVVIFNGIEDKKKLIPNKKKTEQFVIGCVARMDVSKGVLFLLEAFEVLSKKYDHLRLVLVGKGDASIKLEKRVKELGLEEKVDLVGYYDGDIFELINSFDVYVFPSLWEGLPYSIIEALCLGRAIIATKVGGIPEVIADGKNGLLISPASKNDIINAIQQLINDPDLCMKLSKNARLQFEEELTIKHMNLRIKEVFSFI